MLELTDVEIKNRMRFDNPWWDDPTIEPTVFTKRRVYFEPLLELLTNHDLRRAAVLMGPRRVGKTVLLRQLISQLIADGVPTTSIMYLSLENPVFQDLRLEQLFDYFKERFGHSRDAVLYVVFDEIQYLKNWERHLKVMVDDPYSKTRFIVSGSAAAALKRKSRESGAGRFTDFLLPPLTFYEYCEFKDFDPTIDWDIDELNEYFVHYLNYGGFPEIVFDKGKEANLSQHLGQDIIDRVLLRDLPSLYGIADPVELNRFFRVLALNTGQEVSLEALSKKSNVSKNTLKNYLEYLESAFLIFRLDRVDKSGRIFKRATTFKIYLTNPSLRTALYGPMEESDKNFGALVETGYFAQMLHSDMGMTDFYARWDTKGAEVDHVTLDFNTMRPYKAIEIKWSDRIVNHPEELKGLKAFIKANPKITENEDSLDLLVKSKTGSLNINGATINVYPVCQFCYYLSAAMSKYYQDGGINLLLKAFHIRSQFKERLKDTTRSEP